MRVLALLCDVLFTFVFITLRFINSGTQTSQPHPCTRTHCLWPFVSCFTLNLHKYRTLTPFLWTSFKLELAVVINLRIYQNRIQIFIEEVVIMGHQISPPSHYLEKIQETLHLIKSKRFPSDRKPTFSLCWTLGESMLKLPKTLR